jgi:hypothetical protein
MDEETQWVIEEIENESVVAPTIIADNDSDLESGQQRKGNDVVQQIKNEKKRKRLEKLKAASKRHKQEKHHENCMRGVELLDVEQQVVAFQSLLHNTNALELIEASDFVQIPSGQDHGLNVLGRAIKSMEPGWKQLLLGDVNPAAGPAGLVIMILTYSARRAVSIIKSDSTMK